MAAAFGASGSGRASANLKATLEADGSSFVFVSHRAANSLAGFDAAERAFERFHARATGLGLGRDLRWAAEGDLHWRTSAGSPEWFFWHPAALVPGDACPDGVSASDRSGWGLHFDRMLERASRSSAFLALELKEGSGDREDAFRRLAEAVRAHGLQQRVWVDSYSLDDLLAVRRVAPDLPLSLHTPFVLGRRILLIPAAVRWRTLASSLRWRDLRRVEGTEILTTFVSLGRSATRRKAATLRSNGRRFVAGGLFTPGLFRRAWLAGAAGGYVRFDLERLDRPFWDGNGAGRAAVAGREENRWGAS